MFAKRSKHFIVLPLLLIYKSVINIFRPSNKDVFDSVAIGSLENVWVYNKAFS